MTNSQLPIADWGEASHPPHPRPSVPFLDSAEPPYTRSLEPPRPVQFVLNSEVPAVTGLAMSPCNTALPHWTPSVVPPLSLRCLTVDNNVIYGETTERLRRDPGVMLVIWRKCRGDNGLRI